MKAEDQIYYAHRVTDRTPYPTYFHCNSSRRWVALNGMEDCTIVPVRLRERRPEDPPILDGGPDYWGWLPTDEFYRSAIDNQIRPHQEEFLFVWPSHAQMSMCFPYGPRAEEQRGRGRMVNLIIEEI